MLRHTIPTQHASMNKNRYFDQVSFFNPRLDESIMIRGQVFPRFSLCCEKWHVLYLIEHSLVSRLSIGKRYACGYIHLPLSLPFSYTLPHLSSQIINQTIKQLIRKSLLNILQRPSMLLPNQRQNSLEFYNFRCIIFVFEFFDPRFAVNGVAFVPSFGLLCQKSERREKREKRQKTYHSLAQ